MERFGKLLGFPAIVLFIVGMFPVQAYAYLDPGTGSFILQMAIAGLLGGMLYIKLAWANVKMFFSGLLSKSEEPEPLQDTLEEKPGPERQL
jgi:hypothetical protein